MPAKKLVTGGLVFGRTDSIESIASFDMQSIFLLPRSRKGGWARDGGKAAIRNEQVQVDGRKHAQPSASQSHDLRVRSSASRWLEPVSGSEARVALHVHPEVSYI